MFFIQINLKMSLDNNQEMVPSAAKPMLIAFNSRMFSLWSKSMSQIFLLFLMTFAFTHKSFFKSPYKTAISGASIWYC